jgi:hypothetical protein
MTAALLTKKTRREKLRKHRHLLHPVQSLDAILMQRKRDRIENGLDNEAKREVLCSGETARVLEIQDVHKKERCRDMG